MPESNEFIETIPIANLNDHPIKEGKKENSKDANSLSTEDANSRQRKKRWRNVVKKGLVSKKVLKHGIPSPKIRKGDICTVSFAGRLKDGTIVDEAKSAKVHFMYNELVHGLDLALGEMGIGEEAVVKVKPSLAYGLLGKEPDVPPGERIIYNITLENIQEGTPVSKMSIEERIKLGVKLKERGHWWFSRREYSTAVNCYRLAMEHLSDIGLRPNRSDEVLQKLYMERANTLNNLASAELEMNAFDLAMSAIENVLRAQPYRISVLFKKSKSLKEKRKLLDSLKTFKKVMSYEESSLSLKRGYSSLLATQRKHNARQRELFKILSRNK